MNNKIIFIIVFISVFFLFGSVHRCVEKRHMDDMKNRIERLDKELAINKIELQKATLQVKEKQAEINTINELNKQIKETEKQKEKIEEKINEIIVENKESYDWYHQCLPDRISFLFGDLMCK